MWKRGCKLLNFNKFNYPIKSLLNKTKLHNLHYNFSIKTIKAKRYFTTMQEDFDEKLEEQNVTVNMVDLK